MAKFSRWTLLGSLPTSLWSFSIKMYFSAWNTENIWKPCNPRSNLAVDHEMKYCVWCEIDLNFWHKNKQLQSSSEETHVSFKPWCKLTPFTVLVWRTFALSGLTSSGNSLALAAPNAATLGRKMCCKFPQFMLGYPEALDHAEKNLGQKNHISAKFGQPFHWPGNLEIEFERENCGAIMRAKDLFAEM